MGQLLGIFSKDLLIEWRARARVLALGCFALTLLLLFSFAVGPDTEVLRQHAAAYLWMSLLLTSTLLLERSFQVEVEAGAIETLLLAPADPVNIFYGKATANAVVLSALGVVALGASVVLFDVSVAQSPWLLALVVVLGAAGMSAPGTLYAALTARVPAQQVMLPLLLFPLIVPALLAAVKATSLVLLGDPMGQTTSWLGLLACFDVIYWSLCGILFGKVIET